MKVALSAVHIRRGRCGSHEPYLLNLLPAVAKSNTRIDFVLYATSETADLNDHLSSMSWKIVAIPRFMSWPPLRVLFEQLLVPILKKLQGIDTIHYPGTGCSLFADSSDVVTVHHDATSQPLSHGRIRRKYFQRMLGNANRLGAVVVPSSAYRDELVANFGLDASKLVVVHHGTAPYFVPSGRDSERGEPTALLSVTNDLPHKNLEGLLRGYACVDAVTRSRHRLRIVGRVDPTRVSEVDSRLGLNLGSSVTCMGILEHDKLPRIYGDSVALVFVSVAETFGMPLTEAMACGVPVIASDIPVHREVLGDSGILVNPLEPSVIGEAMTALLSDEEMRSSMRASGLARAHEFTWELAADRLIAAYDRVGGNRG